MPYTATTPTLVLCQDLADFVQAAWNPSAPDAVTWDFFRRWGDADQVSVPKIQGRQVVFFPAEDYEWETGTRAQDEYTHRVSCLVVERYTDGAGDPPRDWTAARVDFVHTQIVQGTRFTRDGPAAFNTNVMTLRGSVQVCDLAKLTQSGKLFYALVQIEFMELVTP